ncbi:MAG: glycosyltransferase family 2 protein [Desulfovibrionales bacterium]
MSKVSIIILNWNTKKITEKCIKKVRKYTNTPYELILVDNGSTDGSQSYIASLHSPDTKTILLEKNIGFAAGNNKGLEVATGEKICFLNSDAFVTKGWLSRMVQCMDRTGAGMVGPWTNRAKGSQRRKLKHRLIPLFCRRPQKVQYLSFFCVLIDRSVFREIGNLDDSFALGTYEDDDFCKRALNAGFDLIIEGKSWVRHEGHATMKKNNINESDLLNKNTIIFNKKWGHYPKDNCKEK